MMRKTKRLRIESTNSDTAAAATEELEQETQLVSPIRTKSNSNLPFGNGNGHANQSNSKVTGRGKVMEIRDKILKLFKCIVCTESLNIPVELGCGHVVCKSCIARSIETKCPVCNVTSRNTGWNLRTDIKEIEKTCLELFDLYENEDLERMEDCAIVTESKEGEEEVSTEVLNTKLKSMEEEMQIVLKREIGEVEGAIDWKMKKVQEDLETDFNKTIKKTGDEMQLTLNREMKKMDGVVDGKLKNIKEEMENILNKKIKKLDGEMEAALQREIKKMKVDFDGKLKRTHDEIENAFNKKMKKMEEEMESSFTRELKKFEVSVDEKLKKMTPARVDDVDEEERMRAYVDADETLNANQSEENRIEEIVNEEQEEDSFGPSWTPPDESEFGILPFVPVPRTPTPPPPKKPIFCPTRLNRDQLSKLTQLCKICDGEISSRDYTDEVTHLILVLEDNRISQTMKYLLAIAGKKWVLTFDWVEESLRVGHLVPEESYETSNFPACDPGVKRSRLSPTWLFQDFSFYIPNRLTSYGVSVEDCKRLLLALGAFVLDELPEKGERLLIIGDNSDFTINYLELYEENGWLAVSWDWVLDCVLSYTLMQFSANYILTPGLDGIVLNQARVPYPLLNL